MKRTAFIITFGMFLFVSCGTDQYGGGISDHGNERVAGVVTDKNGNPAAGITVTILPDDYNPLTDSTIIEEKETVTRVDGGFEFDSLDEGAYTVRARDPLSNKGCIRRNIAAGCLDGGLDTLALTVNGSIYFEVDSLELEVGFLIYLPGLPCFDVIDSSKIVNLSDIPTGRIALKAYNPVTGKTIELGEQYLSIEIIPGATLLLPSRSPKPYCLRNDSVVTCVTGRVNEIFTFSAVHPSKTIDGNYIYRFSWGEGTISSWEVVARQQWAWSRPGFYSVQTQVMRQGVYLAWSDPIMVEIVEGE